MHPESTPTWLVGPEIPPTQRIGTILSGSYRLDAFLGQGMTGITYNAWHLRQKQPYAVKLLHRELQPSHERVLRVRTDLRVLSSLRRHGFLPVELSFAPDGAPFLASELLIGETLRERLSRGPLPSLAAGIVVAALARALGEAHKLDVVHGDLRPENVLLPSEPGREVEAGQPILLDAALHHLRRRPIGLDESLPLLKLAYLAPEQTSGEQPTADAAGDMFALGAIFYECLTGKAAFYADELEVVYEKLSQPPAKLILPREVGAPPGLAEALDEVIARACARVPSERYSTMAEFLEALSTAYSRVGLPLPPPDERVAIETVQSQNRGLRKRTVAVKKIGPAEPASTKPGAESGKLAAEPPKAGEAAKTDETLKSAESSKPVLRPKTPVPAASNATPAPPRKTAPAPAASSATPAPPRKATPAPAASSATPAPPRKTTPAPSFVNPAAGSGPVQTANSGILSVPRQPTPQPSAVSTQKATPAPVAPAEAGKAIEPQKAAPGPAPQKPHQSTTAKHRAVRRTVKARDLGRLLAEVAAGRLSPEQAMAMAAGQEDLPDPTEAAMPAANTAQRIIDEGRAAVLARAEAAKRNRQAEADERVQRAQEQQKRLLEQARQETLARMRAEMAESQVLTKAAAKEKDEGERTASEDPELLAEAEKQRQRLEAERLEAERQAQQEEYRAREEASAAELARSEAARAAAALVEAEQREAARAEAMRVKTEQEAEARRLAEQKEAERLHQLEEAAAAERAAAEARERAAQAAAQAEKARAEVEREAEMVAWEEGLVEIVEPIRPPPPPPEALHLKSEKALEAVAMAEEAERQAAEAAQRAFEVRQQAASIARAAEEALSAANAAEQARAREAAELAEAVASAEAARARDQELMQLAAAASERATAAESARQRHVARATRVTQALAILKQVQDMAQSPPNANSSPEAATATPASPPAASAPPAPQNSLSTAPMPVRPEPSGIYAGYSLSEAGRDPSGILKAPLVGGRPEFTGPYAPAQITPAVEQATQSPTRPMPIIPLVQPKSETGEVVEISALLPGAALAIPSSSPGFVPSAQANQGHSQAMRQTPFGASQIPAGATVSGAMPPLPNPMSPSAMHPMLTVQPDTRQVVLPQMVSPHLHSEPGGVTLTVRQFVVTLTVTSLLSAIIGALIALLVMQRSQPLPPIDRPILAGRSTGIDTAPEIIPAVPPTVQTQPMPRAPQANPSPPPTAPPTAPPANPLGATASQIVPGTPPAAPALPSPTTMPAAPSTTPATSRSIWRPASVKLPALRLASDQPIQVQTQKPRVPGPGPLAAPAQTGGTAAPANPPTTAAAANAGDAKPAAGDANGAAEDTKPAPAAEGKEAPKPKQAKPAQPSGSEDGLRNPFGP